MTFGVIIYTTTLLSLLQSPSLRKLYASVCGRVCVIAPDTAVDRVVESALALQVTSLLSLLFVPAAIFAHFALYFVTIIVFLGSRNKTLYCLTSKRYVNLT